MYNNIWCSVELNPLDGRKSFYGKAKAWRQGDEWYCVSYDTIVCSYNPRSGLLTRLWPGYSATTMRHVNAFLALVGIPYRGKAFWDGLPVNRPVNPAKGACAC